MSVSHEVVTLEAELARIVCGDRSTDPEVVARAVAAFTDTVACMLAGASEDAPRTIHRALDGWVVADGASIIGGHDRLAPPFAAIVNGAAAHVLDYDDVLDVALCHPSAVLVPAVLALGEERSASGADLVDAYVVGFEVLARLGEVMNPVHYGRGWHATSSLGALAAAAACARLAGLDEERSAAAISVSTSMAAGLKRQFGTMAKSLHAGLAAGAGVLAARLAESGMTAGPDVLSGERGFVELYAGPVEIDGEPSTVPALLRHGVWTKAFPSCASTHRGVAAVLEVCAEEAVTADDVVEIAASISTMASQSLPFGLPDDGLQAKFSLPYCLASALLDGRLRLPAFTAGAVRRREVRALAERVRVETYGSGGPERASVAVRTRDGRTHEREVVHAPGSPARPLTAEALAEKFAECAGARLRDGRASEAFDLCGRLHLLPHVEELTRRIADACAPAGEQVSV